MTAKDEGVGYGKPPKSKRYKKGVSGNPTGRKRGKHRELPYETVLGQLVTIHENGIEHTVTAEEAILRKMMSDGAKGDVSSAVQLTELLEQNRHRNETRQAESKPVVLDVRPVRKGTVSHHLRDIGILKKFDRFRSSNYSRIDHRAVQDALAQLGDRRLAVDEQIIVLKATDKPSKVKWPDWWEAK